MSNPINPQPSISAHPAAQAFPPLTDVHFPQITWEDLTAAIDLAKAGPPPKVSEIPLSSLFANQAHPNPPHSIPPVANHSQRQQPPQPSQPPQQPQPPMQQQQQPRRDLRQPSSIQPAFSPGLGANLKPQPAATRPLPQPEQPVRAIIPEPVKPIAKFRRKPKKQRRNSEPINVSRQPGILPISLESLREEAQLEKTRQTKTQQDGRNTQIHGKERHQQQQQPPPQHPSLQQQPHQPQQHQQPQHQQPQHQQPQHQQQQHLPPQHAPQHQRPQQYQLRSHQQPPQQPSQQPPQQPPQQPQQHQPQEHQQHQQSTHTQPSAQPGANYNEQIQQSAPPNAYPSKDTNAPPPPTPVPPPALSGLPPAHLLPFLNAAYQNYQASAQNMQSHNRTSYWPPGQLPFNLPDLSAAIQAAQQQSAQQQVAQQHAAQQQSNEASSVGIPRPASANIRAPAAKDVPCHARSQFLGMQGYNAQGALHDPNGKAFPVNGGIQKENIRGSDNSNWRRRFPPQPPNSWLQLAQRTWGSGLRHQPDGSFQPIDNGPPGRHVGGRNGMAIGNMMNRNMAPPGDVPPNRGMYYNRGRDNNRGMPHRRVWQPWKGGRSRGDRRRRGGGKRYGGRRNDNSNPHGLPLGMTHGPFNLQNLVKQETMMNATGKVNGDVRS